MSLAQALNQLAIARKAVAAAMYEDYPIGSEVAFELANGRQHVGVVETFAVPGMYARSKVDGQLYAVAPERIIAHERDARQRAG